MDPGIVTSASHILPIEILVPLSHFHNETDIWFHFFNDGHYVTRQ